MRNAACLLLALALLVLFSLVGGCSKDKGPSGPGEDPGAAQQKVDEADSLLEEMLYNWGSPSQPEDMDFTEPYELYVEALALSGSHSGANFGAGLLEVMMLTQDPEVQDFFHRLEDFIEGEGGSLAGPGAFSGPVALNGPVFRLDDLSVPIMAPIAMTRGMCRAVSADDPTVGELQDIILNEVLPRINTAVDRLSIVAADETFTFIVTPRMQGDENEDSVELDLTEIYATLTGLNAIQGILWQFCAYNYDLAEYTPEVILDALTPGSPFAALHQGGASRMASAHQAWLNALGNLEAGIVYLESETDDQTDDLIRIDPYDETAQAALDSIKNYIPRVRDLLQSSEMFSADWDGDPSTPDVALEISLFSLYNDPVGDFKELFPPYTPSLVTEGDRTAILITWQADSFDQWVLPDPTIGGLFPGMTDGEFKEIFGVDGEGWEKTMPLFLW